MHNRRSENNPISWMHVAGFVLVLWAVSSDVLAQARELLVTEVSGSATRAAGNAAPVRILEVLKAGERVRLGSGSKVGLFDAAEAQLYMAEGPAELIVGAREITSGGKAVAPRKLHEAYRNVKTNAADLVQGTLVMRNNPGLRILAPEGMVDPGLAHQFSWTPAPGSWRFELSADSGELIYRTDVKGASVALPEGLKLNPGTKYVWGVLPASGSSAPVDWTEFVLAEGASLPGKGEAASERMVHAVWLKSRGLERAAIRIAADAAR